MKYKELLVNYSALDVTLTLTFTSLTFTFMHLAFAFFIIIVSDLHPSTIDC